MDKKRTDRYLISKVKREACSDSYLILKEKYQNICFSVSSHLKYNIIDSIDYVIFQAIQSYDTKRKTKFSTHLWNCAKYHCLNNMKKDFRYYEFKSQFKYDGEPHYQRNEVIDLIDEIPDERVRDVFYIKYLLNNKRSYLQIGKEMNISHTTARKWELKGLEILKKAIKKY